jgi:DNA-binding NtrC family response regulator
VTATGNTTKPAAGPRPTARILVAEDDPIARTALVRALQRSGHQVAAAEDGKQALSVLETERFDLVLTDLAMPGVDGIAVVERVRRMPTAPPVVVLTAHGGVNECVRAMRAGAFNFLVKPYHPTELDAVVDGALADRGAHGRPAAGDRPQITLIGESTALRQTIELIEQVAPTEATVLLLGESGTGKEVAARLVHGFSGRAGGPFVPVNCGAIPEGLVESELFGHTRGAFTGATDARTGRFLEATGGTLFLDEVGELPPAMQVKLLRVLQERIVWPVGDSRGRPVDARIVAATNQDLEARVRDGAFRADLYYRLNVIPIVMPPLRERKDDVAPLATHLLASSNARNRRSVAISEATLECLRAHDWPGNVRELENLIERLVVLDRRGRIEPNDLPSSLRPPGSLEREHGFAQLAAGGLSLPDQVKRFEMALVEAALRDAGGNKTRAAELLGISRTTLLEKLKRPGG